MVHYEVWMRDWGYDADWECVASFKWEDDAYSYMSQLEYEDIELGLDNYCYKVEEKEGDWYVKKFED